MSSQPTYYTIFIELPDIALPPLSLMVNLTANVIVGGSFAINNTSGTYIGNAIANLFSFSVPSNAAGAAYAYFPGYVTELSGTLSTSIGIDADLLMNVFDPVTGSITLAAALPTGSTGPVPVSWTAAGDSRVQPRTCGEIADHRRARHRERQARG